MQIELENRLKALLEEKFKEPDYSDCFLVEIKHHEHNKLDVFVDSDSSLTLNKCRVLSRLLEKEIDQEGWLGEKYVLEVSSPGITRPLQFLRQYKKNIGRKLDVIYGEDEKASGYLIRVDDDQIALEEKVRIKEGKRKKTVVQQTEISISTIKKAVVQISFKKK